MFEFLDDDTANVDLYLLKLKTFLIDNQYWISFTNITLVMFNFIESKPEYTKVLNIIKHRVKQTYYEEFFLLVGIVFGSELMHKVITLQLHNPNFTLYWRVGLLYVRHEQNVPINTYIHDFDDIFQHSIKEFNEIKFKCSPSVPQSSEK